MIVVVGSRNTRKLSAVADVLAFFGESIGELRGIDTDSGVPATPRDKETYTGALNRARKAASSIWQSHGLGIGLESGLVERYGELYEEAWCAIIVAGSGRRCMGYSSGLKVPEEVTTLMADGLSHGDAMARIEARLANIPHHNDTWGAYTGYQIERNVGLSEACRNAAVQVLARSTLYRTHDRGLAD